MRMTEPVGVDHVPLFPYLDVLLQAWIAMDLRRRVVGDEPEGYSLDAPTLIAAGSTRRVELRSRPSLVVTSWVLR